MINRIALPPSSAARRMMCAGSRELEAKYPQEETEISREGTAAHWVASAKLHRCLMRGFEHGDPEVKETHTPNGELITQEMRDGADLYFNDVLGVSCGGRYEHSYIEKPLSIKSIHAECGGIPDYWMYDGQTITIWEYKYGHKFVEVFENWQLIEYASGILDKLKYPPYTVVSFRIVQPRSYHHEGPIREWKIVASELEEYFDALRKAESAAMQPNALCKPNPECNGCNARHACETLQRAALTAIDVSTSNAPWELPAQAVGPELRYIQRAIKALEARESGLIEQATAMIKRGERVPYFRLEESAGRQVWKISASEIITLGELLSVPVAKTPEAITPKQALDAGLPEDIVTGFSERRTGALKLVSENLTTIAKKFK